MSIYKQKVARALDWLGKLTDTLNEYESDLAHEVRHELIEIEDLLINPFQTVPKQHFIHVTTSLCDHDGNSDKAYCDVIVEFEQEISAAYLYVALSKYVRDYREGYYLQVSLQQIETWLNEQKALFRTVSKFDTGFIEDSGITICDFKTDFGSIDCFMEYGIDVEE